MEFLSTSCGGTSSVMVRRSTFWYDSIQGNTKNSPAKIYHDKRWSLIYQCYKIKLIAVSTTILHIFSVVFVVKLFPDTYIISVFYNTTCEKMYIFSEWYTHYKCRRIIQCSYDWIKMTGFSFENKGYCLAFEPVNKSILELYLIPANKSRLSIVYNKLERICVNL